MSVWLGLKDYSQRLASYSLTRNDDTLFAEDTRLYITVNDKGEFDSFDYSNDLINPIGIFRRPAELSVLARGLEDRMNRPVRFIAVKKYGLQAVIDIGNSQERNKLFVLYSSPDFLFVAKVVLSLLAILFAFGAIASEREQGTLQLILSNAVSRIQVLLGKFMGGYVSVMLPFLAAALIAVLLLALSPTVTLGAEAWQRIAFLLLATLGYIAIFFFIGLAISALTYRERWLL